MSTNWKLGDKVIDCSKPRIMAIVNATPDSFFAGSRLAVTQAERSEALHSLIAIRPDIIDVGGQSTRPGSEQIGLGEELSRVIPVIEVIRKIDKELPVTVDTYRSHVAKCALESGADGVNDISACRFEPDLMQVVSDFGCGYVLMHMLGNPKMMQQNPQYDDCVGEVIHFLSQHLIELKKAGIAIERIAIDPGIGFGKRLRDNLALIKEATQFSKLDCPVLFGISRKRFIGEIAGSDDPELRLPGTLGITWSLLNSGVMLHRIHDVQAVQNLFQVWNALR